MAVFRPRVAVRPGQRHCWFGATRVDPDPSIAVARLLAGSQRTDHVHGKVYRRIHRNSPGGSARQHPAWDLADAVANSLCFELLAGCVLDRPSQRRDRCLADWLVVLYRRDGWTHSPGLVLRRQDSSLLLATVGTAVLRHVDVENHRVEQSIAADRRASGWDVLEAAVEGPDDRSAADILVSARDLLGEPPAWRTLYRGS